VNFPAAYHIDIQDGVQDLRKSPANQKWTGTIDYSEVFKRATEEVKSMEIIGQFNQFFSATATDSIVL
jgi:hypothetical protein